MITKDGTFDHHTPRKVLSDMSFKVMDAIDSEIRYTFCTAHSDHLATMTRDHGYFQYVTQVKSAVLSLTKHNYNWQFLLLWAYNTMI